MVLVVHGRQHFGGKPVATRLPKLVCISALDLGPLAAHTGRSLSLLWTATWGPQAAWNLSPESPLGKEQQAASGDGVCATASSKNSIAWHSNGTGEIPTLSGWIACLKRCGLTALQQTSQCPSCIVTVGGGGMVVPIGGKTCKRIELLLWSLTMPMCYSLVPWPRQAAQEGEILGTSGGRQQPAGED